MLAFKCSKPKNLNFLFYRTTVFLYLRKCLHMKLCFLWLWSDELKTKNVYNSITQRLHVHGYGIKNVVPSEETKKEGKLCERHCNCMKRSNLNTFPIQNLLLLQKTARKQTFTHNWLRLVWLLRLYILGFLFPPSISGGNHGKYRWHDNLFLVIRRYTSITKTTKWPQQSPLVSVASCQLLYVYLLYSLPKTLVLSIHFSSEYSNFCSFPKIKYLFLCGTCVLNIKTEIKSGRLMMHHNEQLEDQAAEPPIYIK